MTPEAIILHFQTQAKARKEFVNKIASATLDTIQKSQEIAYQRLIDVIEMDTIELCFFRELEQHARGGSLTSEIVTRILSDLMEFRQEVMENNNKLLADLGPEAVYDVFSQH